MVFDFLGFGYLIEHSFFPFIFTDMQISFFPLQPNEESLSSVVYPVTLHQAPMVVPNPWSSRLLWFNSMSHKWVGVCKDRDIGGERQIRKVSGKRIIVKS